MKNLRGSSRISILHLCAGKGGGAWIAASRLQRYQQDLGYAATLWDLDAIRMENLLLDFLRNLAVRFNQIVAVIISRILGSEFEIISVPVFPSVVIKKINATHYDVVHLHWLGARSLAFYQIGRIEKPLVITAHDLWYLTSVEHIPHQSLYQTGYRSTKCCFDNYIVRPIWVAKRKSWPINAIVVTPSRWMEKEWKASWQTKIQILHIPNMIRDIDESCVPDVSRLSQTIVDSGKKVVLFVSASSISVRHKGFDLLLQSIKEFEKELMDARVEIVVVGPNEANSGIECCVPVRFVGQINNQADLDEIYKRASVLALPSRSDNFPNVVVESLLNDTPVVAFRVGGLEDIVFKDQLGILVEPFKTDLFGKALLDIINADPSRATPIRTEVIHKFDKQVINRQHLNAYHEAINRYGNGYE